MPGDYVYLDSGTTTEYMTSFITEKKTSDLVGKIAALGGSHQAELMQKNRVEQYTGSMKVMLCQF